MKQDWTSVNRVSDSISFLYLEHCHIEQENFAIKAVSESGETPINAAGITVLLLGPGTTVTHRAIVSLSECGCSTVWCGEHLRKYYACGFAKTYSATNMFKQARAYVDPVLHRKIVNKLYSIQLGREIVEGLSINQLRGYEGKYMTSAYHAASKTFGVTWIKRSYKTQPYALMDDPNKALVCAYDLLYSICAAVITAMGYSTALAFVHSGHLNAFSFDLADLFKETVAIPAAFKAVSIHKSRGESLETCVRMCVREYLREEKVMSKLPKLLTSLFDSIEVPYKYSDRVGMWTEEGILEGEDYYGNSSIN